MPDPSWWPDPTGRHQYRYWDGSAWSDHVADHGAGSLDPIDAVPAPVVAPLPLPQALPSPQARPVVATSADGMADLEPALSEHALRRVIPTPDPDPTDVMSKRVTGFLIDAAVCVAALLFLVILLAPTNRADWCSPDGDGYVCNRPVTLDIGDTSYELAAPTVFAVFALVTFAYWAVAEAVVGTTLGKAIVGLRVVDIHGQRIGLGRTAIRWLLLPIDGPLTVFVAGAMLANQTNGHQRLGDRFSDSYVIGRVFGGKALTLPE